MAQGGREAHTSFVPFRCMKPPMSVARLARCEKGFTNATHRYATQKGCSVYNARPSKADSLSLVAREVARACISPRGWGGGWGWGWGSAISPGRLTAAPQLHHTLLRLLPRGLLATRAGARVRGGFRGLCRVGLRGQVRRRARLVVRRVEGRVPQLGVRNVPLRVHRRQVRARGWARGRLVAAAYPASTTAFTNDLTLHPTPYTLHPTPTPTPTPNPP